MAIYCTENERRMYEEKGYWRSLPDLVPSVVFPVRARNHNLPDSLISGKTSQPLSCSLARKY